MSARSRLPKTPASGITHSWVTPLAYGQVRESLDRPEYRFILLAPVPVLAPIPSLDAWSVLLLSDSGQWEISEHGIDYIMGGTRVVEP